MSDTGNSSPRDVGEPDSGRLTASVTQKPIRNRSSSQHSKFRHRATPAKVILLITYKMFLYYCYY